MAFWTLTRHGGDAMTAGTRRQRVTLQQLQDGQDAIGAPVQVWVDVAPTWADVQYLSGLSAIKAGADVSLSRVSIRIRYRAVSAGQRVKHGATVFNIEAVLPDARRVYTDLVCESITP